MTGRVQLMRRGAVAAALLLAGCAASFGPCEVYRCDDGRNIAVTYDKEHDVMLAEWNGARHTLAHQLAASGARYADAQVEFWEKGPTARVTDFATGAATTCRTR